MRPLLLLLLLASTSALQFRSPPRRAVSMCAASTSSRLPKAPLPPVLRSNEPGTWAHDTMSRRVRDEILGRLFAENQAVLAEPTMAPAKALLDELHNDLGRPSEAILRPLLEARSADPDYDTWQRILAEHQTESWLDAPWCVAEFYLYRRVMEAVDFFNSGFDPFAKSKAEGMMSAVGSVEALADRVLAAAAQPPTDLAELEAGLRLFTLVSLWGNRMDLSLWPAGSEGNIADAFAQVLEQGGSNLLADQFSELLACCAAAKNDGGRRVDIIVDNAGFELITDMILADFLVSSGVASEVRFQLKAHPTFVSDAMGKDLQMHVDYLAGLDKDVNPGCQALGKRWAGLLAAGAWTLQEEFFWVQPNAMWEMPTPLAQELSQSTALAFTKGDANYRRLLGDRAWPLDTPFADVVSYFPCPVCALRTLKAELGCGMSAEQTARAAGEDSQWMVNGKYGVIHFSAGENA